MQMDLGGAGLGARNGVIRRGHWALGTGCQLLLCLFYVVLVCCCNGEGKTHQQGVCIGIRILTNLHERSFDLLIYVL